MKLLSWNMWVEGYFDQVKSFLLDADADVICLQEVQDNDPERDVIAFLTGLGYQHVFAMTEHAWGGKEYRIGPALFTRLPVVSSRIFLINEVKPRAVAQLDILVNGKNVHIFGVHLAHKHQKPSEEQEGEATRLIKELPNDHVIVMGDLNATPDSATVQAVKKVLVDTDLASTPTWSMYPKGCEVCLPQAVDVRLDYIFVSKDLKTNSFQVGKSTASDHLPISVNVDV